MPACLSQITMRNFWEKPWPCGGKYPTDFTRIGFHPIKRALARFTGMLCLPRVALATTSSCKLASRLRAAAAVSPPWKENGEPGAGAAAASRGSQPLPAAAAPLLPALLGKQAQKAASLSNYKKIYTGTGS